MIFLVACGAKASTPTTPIPSNAKRTDAELEAACDRKEVEGCLDLGQRYAEGENGVDVDHVRAATLFQRACDLHDQNGCAWYAMSIAEGVDGDITMAYGLLEKACAANVQKGCRGVGYLKYEGRGTAKDIPGATTTLTKACDAKDGISCGLLAVIELNELQDQNKAREVANRGCALDASFACFVAAALTSDDTETFKLLGKACDLGDGEACTRYGATLLAGDGDHDIKRAVELLDHGCRLGAMGACRALGGALLSTVPGITPDDPKAARVLRRACDAKDLSACALLGVAYSQGRGVAKSVQTAHDLFQRACDEGQTEATATGCYYLAITYAKGEGVPQSYVESAKYFERACDHAWGESCAALADQYEQGQGVKQDKDKAAELNYKACELDHVPSCSKDRKKP